MQNIFVIIDDGDKDDTDNMWLPIAEAILSKQTIVLTQQCFEPHTNGIVTNFMIFMIFFHRNNQIYTREISCGQYF